MVIKFVVVIPLFLTNLTFACTYVELFGKSLPLPNNTVVRWQQNSGVIKIYNKESGISVGVLNTGNDKCKFINSVISGEIDYDAKIIKDSEYVTKNGRVIYFYKGYFFPEDNPEVFWTITDCHTYIDTGNKELFEDWSRELRRE